MKAITEKNGWLSYIVPPHWKEEAQSIRRKRDQLLGNLYHEKDTDLKWVGDLGEIAFNHWMHEIGVLQVNWIQDEVVGQPDFLIGEERIDVKTVKRVVPPSPSYTAQISAKHADSPVNQLFFMSYQVSNSKLWLLGGISKEEFLSFARYYGEGEWVHSNYEIRKGHEIYNGPIDRLMPPLKWIKLLLEEQT